MSIVKVVKEAYLTGSKGITDMGTAARNAAGKFGDSISGSTLKTNLAKFGLVPAVTGAGAGLGLMGLGAGAAGTVNIISDSVKDKFSLDLTTPESALYSAGNKISGWLILAGLVLAGVLIYKLAKKGGKK